MIYRRLNTITFSQLKQYESFYLTAKITNIGFIIKTQSKPK